MFSPKNRLSFRQSIMFAFITLGILISTVSATIHYYVEFGHFKEIFLVRAKEEALFKKKELDLLLRKDIDNLLALSGDSHIINLIEDINNNYKITKHSHIGGHNGSHKEHSHSSYSLGDNAFRELESHLLLTLKSNSDYDHIRYIGNNAYTILRINRVNDKSLVVNRKDLQNVKDRYYFNEGISIKKGEFAFTKIDLNIEHGKMEMPIKPVIRLSVPIFVGDRREGFLIANTHIKKYFDIIRKSSHFDIDLIDGEGEFIIESSKRYDWSRYLSKGYNIFNKHPSLTKDFLKNNEYVSEAIYSKLLDFPNKDNIRIVLKLKEDIWLEEEDSILASTLYAFIAILLISIPFASFFSRTPERLHKELKKRNKHLVKQKIKIEEQKELFKTVLESSLAGVFLYRGKILYSNPSFRNMLGFNKEELSSKAYWELTSDPIARNKIRNTTILRIKGKDFSSSIEEVVLKTKFGDDRHFYVGSRTIKINNRLMGFSTLIDITDIKKLHEEVQELARTDSLTKALNRVSFDEIITKETNRSIRYKKALSLIILDIDHFKLVNDTYGHLTGDRVLQDVVAIAKRCTRASDYLIRWGGEEFFVLLPETGVDGAFTVANNIRKEVSSTKFSDIGSLTLSAGVTEFSVNDSEDSFVKRADDALYRAKAAGRNKVIVSTADVLEEVHTIKVR